MKKILFKSITLLLLWQLPMLGATSSSFMDQEISSGNLMTAGALDFSLRDDGGEIVDILFNETSIAPDPSWFSETLSVMKDSGFDFEYSVWFEKTGGDDDLCDALELKARKEGTLIYSGALSGFNYDAGGISGSSDAWGFEILFDDDDNSLQSLGCEFDFVYRGEQAGGAGFYDEERASNVITTGAWGVSAGDVVINEIMWMGSTVKPGDEWIELRNTTDHEIDVGKWEIENAQSGGQTLHIPASKIIPAGGYLLIAHYPETAIGTTALNAAVDVVNASISLANEDNGNLVLKDEDGNIIDEAKGDSWPEGSNGTPKKKSMERNDSPGDGTQAGSWHTCEDDDPDGGACNSGTFWDTDGGNNYGTPGAANLSENDPTSKGTVNQQDSELSKLSDDGGEEPKEENPGEDSGDEGSGSDGDDDGIDVPDGGDAPTDTDEEMLPECVEGEEGDQACEAADDDTEVIEEEPIVDEDVVTGEEPEETDPEPLGSEEEEAGLGDDSGEGN